jgi:hypothetical protein
MKKALALFLGSSLIFATSCGRGDKEKPEIVLVSPEDSSVFTAGSDLAFAALITDNEALSQFKIDIHENFEGHAHDKTTGIIWSKVIIENISGIEASPTLSIPVPANAGAGWYHLIVTAVDASGNQSDFALRDIKIQNPADTVKPEISLTSPTENGTYPLGQPVSVLADITDDQRIYIIQTRIRRPNSASNLFSRNDTLNTAQTTYEINIPTTGSAWTAGNYELTLRVYDGYFNQKLLKIGFSLN